jgi:transcription antitermination protein NusB
MGQRRKAREAVLECLYSYEIRGNVTIEDVFPYSQERHQLDKEGSDFALELLRKTTTNIAELDRIIARHIDNWDLARLATIDKNILRLGLAELNYFPEIPKKVTIDEAIELAKLYGSADSGRFVNGVLDALSKDLQGDGAGGNSIQQN